MLIWGLGKRPTFALRTAGMRFEINRPLIIVSQIYRSRADGSQHTIDWSHVLNTMTAAAVFAYSTNRIIYQLRQVKPGWMIFENKPGERR